MSELTFLENYYNNYDEDARLGDRHGSVEFLTTVKYIEKYLQKGMKICEVGAGTGRYSHYFADKGYHVDAVELVQSNIEVFKKKMNKDKKITIRQGNALDLSEFQDEKYDITLVLGPMYHLYTEEDKAKALSEALRITKRNGLVFVAYCIGDSAIIQHGFIKGFIHELVEKDMVDLDNFNTISKPIDIFELVRKEDVDSLINGFNVERLHYVSTDLFTIHMKDTVDNMDDKTFKLYLKYHFAICERQDMCGLTNHSLDILKKL